MSEKILYQNGLGVQRQRSSEPHAAPHFSAPLSSPTSVAHYNPRRPTALRPKAIMEQSFGATRASLVPFSTLALRADVTIRYKIDYKFAESLPPAIMASPFSRWIRRCLRKP
jgi:hypothetical protein